MRKHRQALLRVEPLEDRLMPYSVSPWSFVSHGVNGFSPTADHKVLTEAVPGAGFGNYNSKATSTITGSNETATVFLNVAGLNIRSGDLKITVTVGSQTQTTILTGNITSNNIPLGAFFVNGSEPVSVSFQFENAMFTDISTSPSGNTIVFR